MILMDATTLRRELDSKDLFFPEKTQLPYEQGDKSYNVYSYNHLFIRHH